MGLGFLLRKFKGIKGRRYSTLAIKSKGETKKIKAWRGISHGFHLVEKGGETEDSVLAQREQVENLEVWLFGTFDQQMGAGITKYLQTHLFNEKLSEYQIEIQAKVAMKKAYISTRANIEEGYDKKGTKGFATAVVMNAERFVVSYIGDYKVVVCTDGVATQIGQKYKRKGKRGRIAGMLRMQCVTNNGNHKPHNNSRLMVKAQKVEPDTNFIILASDGVWEVMRSQEAVDLVNHIEDAQEAAKCLAEEALTRMSKSTISCIVIRFY